MSNSQYKYERMKTRGEIHLWTPKEQASCDVNLSGKKTLVGRDSGECFVYEATKEDSRYGKLSGEKDRDPYFQRGIPVLFLYVYGASLNKNKMEGENMCLSHY